MAKTNSNGIGDAQALGMLSDLLSKVQRGEWRIENFTFTTTEWGEVAVDLRVAPGRGYEPILESPDPLSMNAMDATRYAAAFARGQDLRLMGGSVTQGAKPEFGSVAEYDRDEWVVDPRTGETYKLPLGSKQRAVVGDDNDDDWRIGYVAMGGDPSQRTLNEYEIERRKRKKNEAERKKAKREAEAKKPVTPAGASPARDLDL